MQDWFGPKEEFDKLVTYEEVGALMGVVWCGVYEFMQFRRLVVEVAVTRRLGA